MSTTLFPRNAVERDLVISRLLSYLADPSSDPAFVALDTTFFRAKRDAYIAALDIWAVRSSTRKTTSEAAAVADVPFDHDFRLLAGSIRDAKGRTQPAVISEMLGGVLPGALVACSHQEKVQRTHGLLKRLASRADLRYDAAFAEALAASTAALQTAMTADKQAEAAMDVAGIAQKRARDAFDDGYRRLIRAAQATLDDALVTGVFQRFIRHDRRVAAASAVAGAEAASSTEVAAR